MTSLVQQDSGQITLDSLKAQSTTL